MIAKCNFNHPKYACACDMGSREYGCEDCGYFQGWETKEETEIAEQLKEQKESRYE